jgi:hypothetical protein
MLGFEPKAIQTRYQYATLYFLSLLVSLERNQRVRSAHSLSP